MVTHRLFLLLLTVLLPVCMVVGICIGPVVVDPFTALSLLWRPDLTHNGALSAIIRELRFPRVLAAALAGWALGAAGTAFQGIFRNPLADPYVIGASSGASLGAALFITANVTFLSSAGYTIFAFIGSIATVVIVFIIAGSRTHTPPVIALLLAGTAVSSLLSAIVTILMVIKNQDILKIFYWLLGSFNNSTYGDIALLLSFLLPGILVLQFYSNNIDMMSFGDENAKSNGVPVLQTRYAVVSAATLITASTVAVAGIIGFIGLVAPHICRIIFGPVHRKLYFVSGLMGSILLVIADVTARTVLYPIELPVGIITSLLGAPFFLYLLHKRSRKNFS